ncbi:MAG: hypothetical protein IT364_08165 [Candidatus Hydrogenedentes bacterium]|nr:hypothetical protein [Candidatus Hydrogenedentota bacterium]
MSLACGTLEVDRPTKTPLADLCEAYVGYIRATKTKNSIKVDTWYLRSMFGPVCPVLEGTKERKRKETEKKRWAPNGTQIQVAYVEQITTALIAQMIDAEVQRDATAAKTANRYREILMRFLSWAVDQRGVRMPKGMNPAVKV